MAVLPFDNASNDVNAPDILQRYVYQALKNSPYQVQDLKQTNDFLAKIGIVDGGQLPAVDPVKLAQGLGVQALVYGSVEDFNYTNIGFYLQRKVALTLKVVDGSHGATLWENTASAARRQVNLSKDDAKRAFVKGIADQAADKIFHTPLEEEARQATIKTLYTLPGYQFAGFAKDETTPSGGARVAKGVLKSAIQNK